MMNTEQSLVPQMAIASQHSVSQPSAAVIKNKKLMPTAGKVTTIPIKGDEWGRDFAR